MALNRDQQAGFMQVIKFINGTEKYMNISGPAGTGKTFFISQIAEGILRHKKQSSTLDAVVITATTNKAVAVIAEAMPNRSKEIKTVYNFMNLRVKENFSTGKTSVIPTNSWRVHQGILLIIDECSMVNKELFKWLDSGLSSSCKVIFVGDMNQLAPIREEISPIYTENYNTAYLTIPVRNAGKQALMDLCEQARQTVLTGVFTKIKEVPGVIDFVDGPTLKGVLEREYLKEDPNHRVISYTNKRVIEYNTYIRMLRGYTNPFEVGEILSNNAAVDLMGKQRLYTDQIVRVTSIIADVMNTDIILGHAFRTITMEVEDVTTGRKHEATSFAFPNDRRDVLKHYSDNTTWDKYFRIKNSIPDLRSVAASTTHKAQGSTYDSVIVDLADIGKSTNKGQTARMQYVALSRPKTKITIRGALPDRYFQ